MTASPTYDIAAVGERYGLEPAQVIRRCRDPHHPWPHLRVARNDAKTWLFTDADLDAIDELLRVTGPVVDSWGRERRAS